MGEYRRQELDCVRNSQPSYIFEPCLVIMFVQLPDHEISLVVECIQGACQMFVFERVQVHGFSLS